MEVQPGRLHLPRRKDSAKLQWPLLAPQILLRHLHWYLKAPWIS
ncbi:hypothetical protein ACP4OV_024204 [Aristida adscensionis]